MIDEDSFSVWLPSRRYDDEEDDHFSGVKKGFEPWIVTPSTEGGRVDEYDPLSVIEVERRPYLVAKIATQFSLKSGDRFLRSWLLPRRKVAAKTEAWGNRIPYEDNESTGVRLVCKSKFLLQVLEKNKADLLILIKLHRYESGESGHRSSRFTDTVAVLRVKRDLKIEYFKGAVNRIRQSNR